MYQKLTTLCELMVIITGIMLYIVANYSTPSGTIVQIIDKTPEKPYYTYVIKYLYLGNYQTTGVYRSYKKKERFKLGTGVHIYLNYFGKIKNINFRPIVQEEKNVQAHEDFLKLLFICSLGAYLYLVYRGEDPDLNLIKHI
jgi:hypothetical protein